jgi:hypothetical protein
MTDRKSITDRKIDMNSRIWVGRQVLSGMNYEPRVGAYLHAELAYKLENPVLSMLTGVGYGGL